MCFMAKMLMKCINILQTGNKKHILLGDDMHRISWDKLNNPPQETIDARNRFFEECKKINAKEENGVAIIELDIDLEKVLNMEERKYKVLIDNMVVAERMDLKTATILVKALFDEYYNDYKMVVSVKAEDREVCADGGV